MCIVVLIRSGRDGRDASAFRPRLHKRRGCHSHQLSLRGATLLASIWPLRSHKLSSYVQLHLSFPRPQFRCTMHLRLNHCQRRRGTAATDFGLTTSNPCSWKLRTSCNPLGSQRVAHRSMGALCAPAPAAQSQPSTVQGPGSASDVQAATKMAQQLRLADKGRHIFLCADQTGPAKCCSKADTLASWDYLKKRTKASNLCVCVCRCCACPRGRTPEAVHYKLKRVQV